LLTSLPGKYVPRTTGITHSILDNSTHFIVFLILSILLLKSQHKAQKTNKWKLHVLVTLACLSYGIILEVIQIPIPERAFEWSDVLANLSGAIFGSGLMYFLGYSNEKR